MTCAILLALLPSPIAMHTISLVIGYVCTTLFLAGLLLTLHAVSLKPRKALLWLDAAIMAVGLVMSVSLVAEGQRRPGQRNPPLSRTIIIERERWPDGTPKESSTTRLAYLASDGRVYSCFVIDARCRLVVPIDVSISQEALLAGSKFITIQDTLNVAIPYSHLFDAPPNEMIPALNSNRDAIVFSGKQWTIVMQVDLQQAADKGFTREVWPHDVFTPPSRPVLPPSRRRAVAPPFVIPTGELGAMPTPEILRHLDPAMWIVISDGKVWFIRERQGLPIPPNFRRVWP